MTGPSTFVEYWPTWPEGVQGTELVNVRPQCTFEDLVGHLWGSGSKFQEDANNARGMTDFVSTRWVDNISLLPSLPGGYDWTIAPADSEVDDPKDGSYFGLMRKVRFVQGGIAVFNQTFKGEELQRCVEYRCGEFMVVEACVANSAPMCDRMRVVVRYTLQAVGKKLTQLRIEYHIIYVTPTSSLLKMLLEKGAKGGLLKNFEIYIQSLSNFAPLDSSDEELEPVNLARLSTSSNARSPDTPAEARHVSGLPVLPITTSPISWSRLAPCDLASLMCPAICSLLQFLERLEPLERAQQHLAIERFRSQDGHILSNLLACVVLMVLLRVWIGVLWSLYSMCDSLYVLRPLCGSGSVLAMDIPDSLQEILVAMVMVQIVHWFLGALARSYKNTHAHTTPLWERQHADAADNDTSLAQQSYLSRLVSFLRLAVLTGALTLEAMSNPGIGTPRNKAASAHSSKQQPSAEFEALETMHEGVKKQEESVELKEIGRVVEEVFENERCMPFRGWGHTHFLPTDRLRHWSLRQLSFSSVEFSEVEPAIPDGWRWEEPEWEVDMSGLDSKAVDEDGWMYAVNFSGLVFPPAGCGKKTAATFVRRRRWIRTRIRTAHASACPDASEVSAGEGVYEESLEDPPSPPKDASSEEESQPEELLKEKRGTVATSLPANTWDGEIWSTRFWCGEPKGRHKGMVPVRSMKEMDVVSNFPTCTGIKHGTDPGDYSFRDDDW
eukprot:evm.model.scf_1045.3 EVM.evm.TU.scf_1045.3   scf_1045:28438-36140(+)